MPMYTFECVNCRTRYDAYVRSEDMNANHKEPCETCGQYGVRIFLPPQVKIFKPYTTEHIIGAPITVESRSQEEQLCRSRNLVRADSDTRRSVLPAESGPDLSEAFDKNVAAIKYGRHKRYNAMKYGDAPKPKGLEGVPV